MTVASGPFAEPLEPCVTVKALCKEIVLHDSLEYVCPSVCVRTYTLDVITFPQKVTETQEDALLLRYP